MNMTLNSASLWPRGVLPVVHMPYHANESIDYAVLASQVDYVYASGSTGVVFALASELLRVTATERLQISKCLGEANAGRGALVISVGAENLPAAREFAVAAEEAGATHLMAIPPLHVAPSEAELQKYFGAILSATSIPLVIQDASAYVGRPLSNSFQADMNLQWGQRVGFKPEGAPVGQAISAINQLTEGRAAVYEGSGGGQLVENFRRGITGTMPGADLCAEVVGLWDALEGGQEDKVYTLGPLLASMLGIVTGLDGYLSLEKYILKRRGIFHNEIVRGPRAFQLDDVARAEIDTHLDRLHAALEQ